MIVTFKHKGLEQFFFTGNSAKLNQKLVRRIQLILGILHNASKIEDCNFPGSNLHKLKGNLEGYWSIKVSGNWRIIFRFEEGAVFDVELVDYH